MTDPQQFAPLVAGSHTALFRATLVDGFPTGEDPAGDRLRLIDGAVELDGTAEIRGTADIEVAEPWPTARNLDLSPLGGKEIYLARGVDRGAAGPLWASLGYYRITDVEQDDAANGPLSLSLEDRMSTLIESRFLSPRQWVIGTEVGTIVDEVVHEIYPDAVIVWDDDSNLSQLGRSLIVEESRYEVLDTLATGLGKIFFWNGFGELEFMTIPDDSTVEWTVKGGPGGVMVNASREVTREGVRNAFVVLGEGADDRPPVRAVAIDDQESSPTYFYGPFGQIPRFFSSPFVTTQLQAENAAVNGLRRNLGAPFDVALDAVPNPAVEPYTVTRVVYNDGTREVHVAEQVEIPLNNTDTLGMSTRQSTIVYVGVL